MRLRAVLLITLGVILLMCGFMAAAAHAEDPLVTGTEDATHAVEDAHHDEKAVVHDVESVDKDVKDADRAVKDAEDLDKGVDDFAAADDALLGMHDDVNGDSRNNESEEDPLRDEQELEQAECDRLEIEYYFRHPPGTKPSSLSGLHGCALYRQDAHYHDTHPDHVAILGDNIYMGDGIPI